MREPTPKGGIFSVFILPPLVLLGLLLTVMTPLNDSLENITEEFIGVDEYLNISDNETLNNQTNETEFVDVDEFIQRVRVVNESVLIYKYDVVHRGDVFILLSSGNSTAEITKDALVLLENNETIRVMVTGKIDFSVGNFTVIKTIEPPGINIIELDMRGLGRLIQLGAERIYVDVPMSASGIEEVDIEDNSLVCLLDTGIDEEDDNGHGTRVASFLRSTAPDAEIISVKVLDENGVGYSSDIIEGIEYCREQNVDVILMYFGGGRFYSDCDYDPVAEAANKAAEEGITVIASAGDEDYTPSPACGSSVISLKEYRDFISEITEPVFPITVNSPFISLDYTTEINESITKITFDNFPITKIELFNWTENATIEVDSFEQEGYVQAYAINPLNIISAQATVIAKGNAVYKCKDWDFDARTCLGEWVFLKNVASGLPYNITIDGVDPAYLETYNSTADSTMRYAAPDTNYGGFAGFRVGRPAGADGFRGIIRFDLSSIPTNASITNAALRLFLITNVNPGMRTHAVHRIQQNPARNWTESGVTFNNYTSSAAWTSGGGDYNATPTATNNTVGSSVNVWITFDVTVDVQDFASNPSTNFGWVIRDSNEGATSTQKDYASKENANANRHPQLVINYAASTPPNVTLNAPENDSNFPSVGNIILNATVTDPKADDMTVKFFAGNSITVSDAHGLVYIENNVANGSTVTYNITALPFIPDADTNLLLHFDNRSEYGENDNLAYDFSGTGNNATCAGAACPTFEQTWGKFAGAFELDGTDDYWDINNGYFDAGVANRTTEVWFKANDIATASDQFLYEEGGGVNGFNIYIRNSKVFVGAWAEGNGWQGEWLNFSTTNDEWHYVALLFEGNNRMIMVYDGQTKNASVPTTMPGHGGDDFIGRMGTASKTDEGDQGGGPRYYFNGTLDEFAIYNRTLTVEEAQNHYQFGPGTYYWFVNASDGTNETKSDIWQFNIQNVTACGEVSTDTTLSDNVFSNGLCFNITADNVVLDCAGHTITGNGSDYGVYINNRNNITVKNCRIFNFTDGIHYINSNSSAFRGNSISNTNYGMFMDPTSNTVVENNIYKDSQDGLHLEDSYNNTIRNNRAYNTTRSGFYLTRSTNNIIYNNTAYDNPENGFYLHQSSNNELINNTAYTNLFAGFFLNSSNNTLLKNNTAHSNMYGIYIDPSYNNTIIENNVYNNSVIGLYLEDSHNNTIRNNTAYNNSVDGFYLNESTYNNLTNNTAYNNSQHGFYLRSSSNNNLTDNTAYFNSQDGFALIFSSNNNLNYNAAYNNSIYGFNIWFTANFNSITNNFAHDNSYDGILLSTSSHNILINNTAYDNNRHGFHIWSSSNNNILLDNKAHGNSQFGIQIHNSNGTNASNTHLYNNALGSMYITTDAAVRTVYLYNMTIDNPLGSFQNYTSLSIEDTVEANTAYSIDWTTNSSALPTNLLSFAQKFVNISNVSGSVSIDSIIWNWNDSELAGYDENYFELWRYNASGWVNQNAILNTAANTLSLTNMNPASDYGILQSNTTNITKCRVISSPGLYNVMNGIIGADIDANPLPGYACIKVTTSDVYINFQDYGLENDNLLNTTYGILLNGSLSNVTILGYPEVSNYSYGIYVMDSENVTVEGTTVFNNSVMGMELANSSNLFFNNITMIDNPTTLTLTNISDSILSHLRFIDIFNLTAENCSSAILEEAAFENADGSVTFHQVNLTNSSTGGNILVEHNHIYVNDTAIPDFDTPAGLVFENLIDYYYPYPLRDGAIYIDHYALHHDYGNSRVHVGVMDFSNYTIANTTECLNFTIFKPPVNIYANATMCPGTYYVNTTFPLVVFRNNSIYLDCNGSVIIGNGLGGGILSNFNDTDLRNCTIRNYDSGFDYLHTDYTGHYIDWSDNVTPSSGYEIPLNAFADEYNNFLATGYMDDCSGGTDWLATKYTPTGNHIWNYTFSSGNTDCVAWDANQFAGGDYILIGYQDGGLDMKWRISRHYQDTGSVVWSSTWNPSFLSADAANGVVVDSKNNFVVGGYTQAFLNDQWTIRKYKSDGTVVWTRNYNPSFGSDRIMDVTVTSKNTYVAVGYSTHGFFFPNERFRARAWDENGNVLWTRNYNPSDRNPERLVGVAVDAFDNIIAVGYDYAPGAGDRQGRIFKLTPTGNLIWMKEYNPGSGYDSFYDVRVDKDNNYIVAGVRTVSGSDTEAVLRKYDPDGNVLWTYAYNQSSGEDVAWDVAVDSENNYFIAGSYDAGGGNHDWDLIKLNASYIELQAHTIENIELQNNTRQWETYKIANLFMNNITLNESFYFKAMLMENSSAYNTTLENEYGKVFYSEMNFTNSSTYNGTNGSRFLVRFTHNLAEVDSEHIFDFNYSAELTFYNITGFSNPATYRNGATCGMHCTPIAGSGPTYYFNISSFTNYSIGNGTGCTVIDTSDTYILGGNLEGAPISASPRAGSTCIKIAASDVILDCNGYNITNNGTAGTTRGILLNDSLTNVTVRNCPSISQYSYGIEVYRSNDSVFTNNSLHNNSFYGFYMFSGDNNNISWNNAYNNTISGMLVEISDRNIFENNSVYNNSNYGIYLQSGSSNNTLRNNSVYDNQWYGIIFLTSSNNSLIRNRAWDNNLYGFYISLSEDNSLTSNTAYGNNYGFFASSSNLTRMKNNHAYNNTVGIYINDSMNSNISSNNVSNNTGYGIAYCYSNYTLIYNNTLNGNDGDTINGINSDYVNISYNTLRNGGDDGIVNYISVGSRIIGNNLSEGTVSGSMLDAFANDGIDAPNNTGTIISGNNISTVDLGVRCDYCRDMTIENNRMDDAILGIGSANIAGTNMSNNRIFDTTYGFYLIGSSTDLRVVNNTVYNNTYGLYLRPVSNSTFENNTIYNSTESGFFINGSSNNIFSENKAYYSKDGFHITSNSNRNNFTSNRAYNNSQYGFNIKLNSDYNALRNNTAYNNGQHGFYAYSCSNNSFTNNSVHHNLGSGFLIQTASNNNLTNNTAYLNNRGFFLDVAINNKLTNNEVYHSTHDGFLIYTNSNYNTLTNNTVYNNSNYGFKLEANHNNTLINNTAYNNGQYGLYIFNSSDTNSLNTHLYDNDVNDFAIDNGATPKAVYLSSLIIDNPVGNYQNYTNLSITDTVGANSGYAINWTTNSTTLPTDRFSFREKFVDITNTSGSVSIDFITWHWSVAEEAGYNENYFELWKWNATDNWTMLNNTPNTSANTLSLTNMNPASIYCVLEKLNQPPTQGIPVLNSTYGTNYTKENLTCWNISTSDPDGDSVKNIHNWYKNGSSIMALNMPFEGGSNSTYTKDYSGNGNNGVVTNAVWNSTSGYDGWGAYEFNGSGSNGYILSTNNLGISGNVAWTAVAWVYPRTNPAIGAYGRGVIGWGIAGNNRANFLYYNGNENTFEVGFFGNDAQTAGIYQEDNWYFIVNTYNGSHQIVYVNGTEVINRNAGPINVANSKVKLGVDLFGQNRYFNGTIDEVRIYDYALSKEQVQALFQNETNTIVSQETEVGDVWGCSITPNDGKMDGSTNMSNNLTILQECMIINSSGDYRLINNLEGAPISASPISGTTCIKIAASDVVFDCDGFNITNNGTAGTTRGILLIGSLTNITVKNCPGISQHTYGIEAHQSNDGLFTNNTAHNNSYGFYFNSSSYNNLTNNRAYNNTITGFYLQSSNLSRLKNNTAHWNQHGIYLDPSYNNTIIENNLYCNSQDGLYLEDSHNNTIRNNTAYNNTRHGFHFYDSSNNNLTNNTIRDSGQYGIYLNGSSENNQIYFNYIYNSVIAHAHSPNLSNKFYDNSTGTPMGNYWEGVLRLEIYDTNNDGYGDWGAQYPYNQTNGGNVTGAVEDYGPITQLVPKTHIRDKVLIIVNKTGSAIGHDRIWKVNASGSGDEYASPIAVNGVVYYASKNLTVGWEKLWAFNASTGEQLWNFSDAYEVDDTPTYTNGFVYVTSWDYRSNQTFKINASTGVAVWNHTMSGKGGGSPIIDDGLVYTMNADDCIIFALNDSDGTEVWNFTKAGPCYAATSLAMYEDILFFETFGTAPNLLAINKTDGNQIWNLSIGNFWDSAVSIDAETGIAYACNSQTPSKNVTAFYPNNGTIIWIEPIRDCLVYPAIADNYIIAGADRNFSAFDKANGSLIWNIASGSASAAALDSASELFFAGNYSGDYYLRNVSDGSALWRFDTRKDAGMGGGGGSGMDSSSALMDGNLYFGSNVWYLYAFDVGDGAGEWPTWGHDYQRTGYCADCFTIHRYVEAECNDTGNFTTCNITNRYLGPAVEVDLDMNEIVEYTRLSNGLYHIHVNGIHVYLPEISAKSNLSKIEIKNGTAYNSSIPRLFDVTNPDALIHSSTFNISSDITTINISGPDNSTANFTVDMNSHNYDVTRDGAPYTNYTWSGNNITITTDLSSHVFEIKPLPSACMIISSSGEYQLTDNAVGAPISASEVSNIDWTCIKIASDDVDFSCNGYNITNNGTVNAAGIVINGSAGVDYTNVTIRNCPGVSGYKYGAYIYRSSEDAIRNATAFNSTQYAFYIRLASNNTLNDNTAYENNYGGFYIYESSDNNLTNNTARDNLRHGIYLNSGLGNFFINNMVYNNSRAGFNIESGGHSKFIENIAYNNSNGILTMGLTYSNLTNNTVYNNTNSGIELTKHSNNNQVVNNTAFGNGYGLLIRDSSGNSVNRTTLYRNAYDFYANCGAGHPTSFNITGMVFKNPSGTLKNYTNLSITDALDDAAGEQYSINWTANSSGLPSVRPSFAQKFVNISTVVGSVSIDSITWSWLDSELTGYNESMFELWKYNSGGWSLLNNSPDTSANTLSLTGMNPASEYGILQQNITQCFYANIPNTVYTLTSNLIGNKSDGACITINTTNVTINGNGYRITGDTIATTYGVYTISKTGTRVENLTANKYRYGMVLWQCSNVIIKNCSVPDTLGGSNFDIDQTNGFLFENNTADNPGINTVLLAARDANNGTVKDNAFRETTSAQFYLRRPNNVSIYNNTFTSTTAQYGINFDNMNNCSIYDNIFTVSNTASYFRGAYNTTIYDNIIRDGTEGINLRRTGPTSEIYNITLRSNNITNMSGTGIMFYSTVGLTSDSTIINNTVNASTCAINMTSCRNNILYNNVFNASTPAYDDGGNYWNTTQQTGPNLIGGQDIGGNFYSDYPGFDADGDGIGETSYPIAGSGGTIDYLPLTNNKNVTTCFYANVANKRYNLSTNIFGNKTDVICITINAKNVTIDCRGFNITGNAAHTTGIYSDHENSKVYNCNIYNYTDDLYFNGNRFGEIVNTSSWYAAKHGFLMGTYDNTNLTNVTAVRCDTGIHFAVTSQNQIFDATIINSTGNGLYIDRSSDCDIYNTTITSNGSQGNAGIYIRDSNKNTFTNVTSSHGDYAVRIRSNSDRITFIDSVLENSSATSSSACVLVDSSTGCNFTRTNVRNCTHGFMLVDSNDSRIVNSNATNSTYGIYLDPSYNNSIIENNLYSNSQDGLYLYDSHNNTVRNNTAYNNTRDGFRIYLSTNNTFMNNTAYNNTNDGFHLLINSGYNSLTANKAYNNTRDGFHASTSSDNNFTNNTAYRNRDGFFLYNLSKYNILINNTAYNNSDEGLQAYLDCDYNIFTDNTAYNNSDNGFYVYKSVGNNFTNNTAYNSGNDGFRIRIDSNYNTFINNTAYNNSNDGIHILVNSSYNKVIHNKAYNNSRDGFHTTADSNNLSNNTAYENAFDGFFIYSSSSNILRNNTAYQNHLRGFNMWNNSNNVLIDNTAYNNTDVGFRMNTSSEYNNLTNNRAYNNTLRGFLIESNSSYNILTNNSAYENGMCGFWINSSSNYNNLTNNTAYNNTLRGFLIESNSQHNRLINNTARENKMNGFSILSSYNNTLTDNMAHNNSLSGFLVNASADYNNLTNNIARYSSCTGFCIYSNSDNNILLNNTAYENGKRGFFIKTGSNNTLTNNTAYHNSYAGFAIDSSSYNNLTGNHAYNNSITGIAINSSNYTRLEDNTAYKNQYGIYLDPSYNNTIIENNVYNNTQDGLYLEDSYNNTIRNNTAYNNTRYGFYFVNSDDNNLTDNNLTLNNMDGIRMDSTSSNNQLQSNYVCFNTATDLSNNHASNNGDLDTCDSWNLWNESGHAGCTFRCTEVWHYFFGDVNGSLMLAPNQADIFYNWAWNGQKGKVYVINGNATIEWINLTALGRNVTGGNSTNDFTELDTLLGISSESDNVNATYSTDGSNPKETLNMTLYKHFVPYVPEANSSVFDSSFKTGITWDASQGGPEFNTTLNQDVAFVTEINTSASYDYEIRVPGTLDTYKGTSGVVEFWAELE